MFTKTIVALTLCAFILVLGCAKETQYTSLSPSSENYNNAVAAKGIKDTTGKWYGTAVGYNGDPDNPKPDTISEQKLIKNEKASVPYDSILYPSDGNEFSSIVYQIPAGRNLNGDSIAFQAAVNDELNVVQLDLVGTKNIASISYNKDVNNTGICKLIVGNTMQSVSIPAIDFTTFQQVIIAIKNNTAFFYISNKLILSFKFSAADKIGNITMLSIGKNFNQTKLILPHNQSIDCDYVKLYNSFSKNLVMKEDFNIDGKSNTIFY